MISSTVISANSCLFFPILNKPFHRSYFLYYLSKGNNYYFPQITRRLKLFKRFPILYTYIFTQEITLLFFIFFGIHFILREITRGIFIEQKERRNTPIIEEKTFRLDGSGSIAAPKLGRLRSSRYVGLNKERRVRSTSALPRCLDHLLQRDSFPVQRALRFLVVVNYPGIPAVAAISQHPLYPGFRSARYAYSRWKLKKPAHTLTAVRYDWLFELFQKAPRMFDPGRPREVP